MKTMLRIILLCLCLTASVQAASVLWFGVNKDADLINGGTFVSSVIDYANINAVRITANGAPLHLYWQMTDEFGNYLYDELYNPKYGLEVVDEDTGETYYIDEAILRDGDWYGADWSSADLGNNEDMSTVIKMELGYVDLDDWDSIFEPIAYYETTLDKLWEDDHISVGGLSEPTFSPWEPDFYILTIPVPEPSTTFLVIFGLCIILMNRRNQTF